MCLWFRRNKKCCISHENVYAQFRQTIFIYGLFKHVLPVSMLLLPTLQWSIHICICNSFSEPATMFHFWLVYGSDNSQITPSEATQPEATTWIKAFKTFTKLDIQLYDGDVTHTLQSSFGIFLEGKIFSEDLETMKDKLQVWWRSHAAFKTASIEIATHDPYFSPTG